MPTSLTERIDSRRVTLDGNGNPESAEFIYILRGVADDASATTLVTTSTPGAYGQLDRVGMDLEPVHIDTANLGSCIWNVTVHFGKQPETTGSWTFEFDTGGGTQHVTQSKATISKKAASGTAPDFKGAIGVTKDSVEGVDVVAPVMNFTGRYVTSGVTGNYIVGLYQLTGKTNAATWTASFAGVGVQFDAGEVLF